jgi:glucose/arabinose dehydrogenase/PKD repeat protein
LPVILVSATPAQGATLPSGFQERVVFSGLTQPANVEFSPDGRVFVAEKSGLIKVFDSLTDTTPSSYADLRTQVYNFWDRGLLGMALHPNFPTDPRVYVLYTYDAAIGGTAPTWGTAGATDDNCPTPPGPTTDGCLVSGRLSVLTPGAGGSPPTEQVLINDWCQQYASHSIGTLAFGGDGMLYAGGGDGASFDYVDWGQDNYPASDVTPDNPCGDPPSPVGTELFPPTSEGGALRAQDIRTTADPTGLDGSIIRIDPDTGAAAPGNPDGQRIVTYGLRNPFRFTVRPGTTELWIGDVGWGIWEEINRVPNPQGGSLTNFGWPCYEGPYIQHSWDATNLNLCESLYAAGPSAVRSPHFAYTHDSQVVPGDGCPTGNGSAISGLAFHTTGSYPAAYTGALFFSDYSRGCVWAMLPDATGQPDPARVQVFAGGAGSPVELQTGPGGDLFAVDLNAGQVKRYVYTAGNNNPVAVLNATPTSGDAPLTVSFDATSSSDADGDPLSFAWDLDGDGAYDDSTAATPTWTYTTVGPVTAGLQVTDGRGGSDTAQTVISVGNTPPTATIISPTPGTQWQVGDVIGLSGAATDQQDGTLPGSALQWTIILHHCLTTCHTHQITSFTGASGSFTAPDHGYPSYLEVRLTATDSQGLSDTETVELYPKTVALTVTTSPPGLTASLGDMTGPTPLTRTVIIGSSNTVAAPSPQITGSQVAEFTSWSDGGAAAHTITAPAAPATYTATYSVGTNLAFQKPVLASSSFSRNDPRYAVDGNLSTRWLTRKASPQWIRVDLGSSPTIGRARLRWAAPYGIAYRIQTSNDGSTWTDVFSTTTGDGGVDEVTFPARTTRYVRMYGTQSSDSQGGYSLTEFEVYSG